ANQQLIMAKGGISLLSMTVAYVEDPSTLRMVARAIARLYRNGGGTRFECEVSSLPEMKKYST
nr:kinesin-like protein KIN-UB isoform X2 [Tanacetum cinerariifolium]